MRKGFISIMIVAVIATISVAASALYVRHEVTKLRSTLGATITQTQLTDTIGTFRTNVNSSLVNLNEALSATTSTDPGHVHQSASVSGTIAIAKGGTGSSTLPASNTLMLGMGTTFHYALLPDCANASTSKILYNTSTRAFSCGTDTDTTASLTISASSSESLVLGDAVFIVYGQYATTTISQGSEFGVASAFSGTQGKEQAMRFSFLNTSTISQAQFPILKISSPTDNLKISLQANTSTAGTLAPSGTDLVSTTIGNAALSGSVRWETVTFATTQVNASTSYWWVFDRTGADDNTNYYSIGGDTATSTYYTRGDAKRFTTSWVLNSPDRDISFFAPPAGPWVAKASASDQEQVNRFIGFANAAYAERVASTVAIAGSPDFFKGLDVGETYYLGNTAGNVSSTVGTISLKVGKAVSTSTIRMQ